MTRSEQLADAMLAIAKVNHNMVGLVETVTSDEINAAEQILITRQNALPLQHGVVYQRYDFALDLIEHLYRERVQYASAGKTHPSERTE